jgi:hypothetical protein
LTSVPVAVVYSVTDCPECTGTLKFFPKCDYGQLLSGFISPIVESKKDENDCPDGSVAAGGSASG